MKPAEFNAILDSIQQEIKTIEITNYTLNHRTHKFERTKGKAYHYVIERDICKRMERVQPVRVSRDEYYRNKHMAYQEKLARLGITVS